MQWQVERVQENQGDVAAYMNAITLMTNEIERLLGRPRPGRPVERHPDQHGVVKMIRIRCQTGDDLILEADMLVGVDLSKANLHRALLDGQNLRGAKLVEAELRSAWLENADFSDADLSRAILFSCVAPGARFSDARLSGAVLSTGIFDRADFTRAKLDGARVGQASFKNALLKGADLRCEGLDKAVLTGAIADETTRWPQGFDPADRGVVVGRIH